MKSVQIACLLVLCSLASSGHAVGLDHSAAAQAPHNKDAVVDAQRARLSAMAPGVPVQCKQDAYGNPACTVDGYQVDLSECGDDMLYGAVVAKNGVTLTDAVNSGHPVARLANKQFVCIEATATKDKQERYFVKAVPVESVARCKGNDLCTQGNQPVQWIRPATGSACRRNGNAVAYTGDCAAGWVDKDTLEEFSMGLAGSED
ncbi:hypothetical protein EC912_101212 [Luteibacter rhizovicinus]|uniref:Uncharacterized protein n=1 Tax=Luteibacter rhizovicinus TaxID=242606 RepID=A0A4R3YVY2_9GAMM|nr:hypothetical protein [Luteibacter rhizovicinus]TCV97217.1 hypothetical protein EC912_101212 [Luteibacter rhizovicinus]